MTGFLARVVARASDREAGLAPRPDHRFAGSPVFSEAQQPSATSLVLAHAMPGNEAPVLGVAQTPQGARTGRSALPIPTNGPASGPVSPPPPAPAPTDEEENEAHSAPSQPRDPSRGRARLMPLDEGPGTTDREPDEGNVRRLPEDRADTYAVAHETFRRTVLDRNARTHRAALSESAAPDIVVHIGRIDVRAVQTPMTPPQAVPKSLLKRPALEDYLRRGRDRS
jgi:hypothetical protein